MEEFSSHVRIPDNHRDNESFFMDMKTWQDRVEKEKRQKKEMKETQEMEKYTFKPEINKMSQKILGKKSRIPIHER